jgi:hypothetical protein
MVVQVVLDAQDVAQYAPMLVQVVQAVQDVKVVLDVAQHALMVVQAVKVVLDAALAVPMGAMDVVEDVADVLALVLPNAQEIVMLLVFGLRQTSKI